MMNKRSVSQRLHEGYRSLDGDSVQYLVSKDEKVFSSHYYQNPIPNRRRTQ